MSDIVYRRICNCGKEIIYSNKYILQRAIKENRKCIGCKDGWENLKLDKDGKWTQFCKLCGRKQIYKNRMCLIHCFGKICKKCASIDKNKGRILSENHKKKLSILNKGKNNKMYGKPPTNAFIKGHTQSDEIKYKLRLATIADLKKKGIKFGCKGASNFNPKACQFIDKLNQEKRWNLQHAKNGGEVELYGYFVDGYDKERNIIFEYDEQHHQRKEQQEKDLIRQENLLREIKPSLFLRYNECSNRLYDCETQSEIPISI